MRANQAPGSHQIVDLAANTAASLNATTLTAVTASGAKWPLLPDMSYHLRTAGLQIAASVSELVKLSDVSIHVLLLDAAANLVVTIWLAGDSYADPTWCQSQSGSTFGWHGDLEIFAGMNVLAPNSRASQFQMAYLTDLYNSDASAHTANLSGTAIFTSVYRR